MRLHRNTHISNKMQKYNTKNMVKNNNTFKNKNFTGSNNWSSELKNNIDSSCSHLEITSNENNKSNFNTTYKYPSPENLPFEINLHKPIGNSFNISGVSDEHISCLNEPWSETYDELSEVQKDLLAASAKALTQQMNKDNSVWRMCLPENSDQMRGLTHARIGTLYPLRGVGKELLTQSAKTSIEKIYESNE